MAMTKEEVIAALNEGRVTCNFKGRLARMITPQKAREFFLDNIDRSFDPGYDVDLSVEREYAGRHS